MHSFTTGVLTGADGSQLFLTVLRFELSLATVLSAGMRHTNHNIKHAGSMSGEQKEQKESLAQYAYQEMLYMPFAMCVSSHYPLVRTFHERARVNDCTALHCTAVVLLQ